MADRLPDLDALRLLVDVAAGGSIGAAGRLRGMTQQGASERLRALETATGLTLLRRSARGTALTTAGQQVVAWASELLAHADRVQDLVEGLRDDGRRDLRVAASMTVAEYFLPRWLVRLRQSGGAGVHLVATNSVAVLDLVARGDADVGFVEDDSEHRDLATTPVATDELVLVAHPDDAWARRRRVSAADVAARPLTLREPGSGTRAVLESALGGLRLADADVELTTTSAIRAAVAAGSAPAFLSRVAVADDVVAGRLVIVPTDLDLRRTLRAVWVGSAVPPVGPVRDLLGIAAAG